MNCIFVARNCFFSLFLRSPSFVFRTKIKNVSRNKFSNLMCEILPQCPLLLGHNKDMKMGEKVNIKTLDLDYLRKQSHCEALPD